MKILDNSSFANEFERCCINYSSLTILSAWCGNPAHTLPFSYLTTVNPILSVEVITGVSYNHTHPDAIKFFFDNNFYFRIFDPKNSMYHPKCYLFLKGNSYALFMGSSNFTYSGFFENTELNFFSEGTVDENIQSLKNLIKKWKSDEYSFIPDENWIVNYCNVYASQLETEKKHKIPSPLNIEKKISEANWLLKASWNLYYREIESSLKKKGRNFYGYNSVLDAAVHNLPLPWDLSVFDSMENRRIIGGIKKYGWLGHVSASGKFRQFLSSGDITPKELVIKTINEICSFELPLDESILKNKLDLLSATGHSIKVWSRLITLLRPDIFCTVASSEVRQNLSTTLKLPVSQIVTNEGYVQLIKFLHSCPWYHSPEPLDLNEKIVWKRRVAFIDAIFYSL